MITTTVGLSLCQLIWLSGVKTLLPAHTQRSHAQRKAVWPPGPSSCSEALCVTVCSLTVHTEYLQSTWWWFLKPHRKWNGYVLQVQDLTVWMGKGGSHIADPTLQNKDCPSLYRARQNQSFPPHTLFSSLPLMGRWKKSMKRRPWPLLPGIR